MMTNQKFGNKNLGIGFILIKQQIWAKTLNVGLAQEFKNNQEIECYKYIKQLMAIPFLPASLINPTYTCLEMPSFISNTSMMKL